LDSISSPGTTQPILKLFGLGFALSPHLTPYGYSYLFYF
jgi:hypothetical protein